MSSDATQNSPIVHLNKVRAACKEGKVQAGCFLAEIRQPSVTQLLAAGGLDFFMIDNEHGQFSIDKIAEICTVARYAGITPFVRVPDYSYSHIAQSLDAGAQGLIFPRITSPEQVRAIIDTARYPPEGNRGNATNRNYCDFRVGDVTLVMATHNRETMLIFQVETKECLERLDEILSIKGVDGVLIGPNDLSISLGVTGQINHPTMIDAFNKVLETCRKHNVVPGCHINDPTLAAQWAAKGFRFVSSSSDTFFVQSGAANVNTLIKDACKQ